MNFTDEQIMNCTLISLKHLRIMYTYFTEEASNDEVFNEGNQLLEEVTTLQRNIYNLMVENNWMSPQAQTTSVIDKALKQLKKTAKEME